MDNRDCIVNDIYRVVNHNADIMVSNDRELEKAFLSMKKVINHNARAQRLLLFSTAFCFYKFFKQYRRDISALNKKLAEQEKKIEELTESKGA